MNVQFSQFDLNDRQTIRLLADRFRDDLLNDVVPFWTRHTVDREHGGIWSAVDRRGNVIDTDKAMWIQGRFCWLLGELCNQVERRDEWLELAIQVGRFIEHHGFDAADGRMWFLVTSEGLPLRKRRYAFTESFAAIAFGELARATGNSSYVDLAERCFQRFVDHDYRALPKFTDTRPTKSIGVPMITIGMAQELRDSIGLQTADDWIDKSIAELRRDFLKPDLRCVMETVGIGGEIIDHFDGRLLNPGHAIETAWFVLREAKHRADADLVRMGCQMLDWSWQRGWDEEFGGLLYFVDADQLPVQEYWHDMKFWWPHNEAIIALLLAFQLSGDAKYSEWFSRVYDWTHRHFPDREFGEWFGYLHRDGSPSSTAKGTMWKGPFHIPRMQLIGWQICCELLADANGH